MRVGQDLLQERLGSLLRAPKSCKRDEKDLLRRVLFESGEFLVLCSSFVILVTSLPSVEGLLQSSIVSNVLAKSELSINMILFAIPTLDRKVTVLIDKALSPLIELCGCVVGPPLKEKENIVLVIHEEKTIPRSNGATVPLLTSTSFPSESNRCPRLSKPCCQMNHEKRETSVT